MLHAGFHDSGQHLILSQPSRLKFLSRHPSRLSSEDSATLYRSRGSSYWELLKIRHRPSRFVSKTRLTKYNQLVASTIIRTCSVLRDLPECNPTNTQRDIAVCGLLCESMSGPAGQTPGKRHRQMWLFGVDHTPVTNKLSLIDGCAEQQSPNASLGILHHQSKNGHYSTNIRI